jgi:tRNA (adenine22-N1)-methyltransferase
MAPLEKRLVILLDWCRSYRIVADIGSGQGRLARALAHQGHRVLATEKTVSGWQELVQYTKTFEQIDPILGDGLKPLLAMDVAIDVAVVAGMGPRAIERIVQQDSQFRRIPAFIVQPMQGLFRMRRYLKNESWFVRQADLVQEHGKLYGMWWIERNADNGAGLFSEWFPSEFLDSPLYPQLIRSRLAQLNQSLRHHTAQCPMWDDWQRERNALLTTLR